MILVIYSGRKETKQQNYNNTYSEHHTTYASDTHTSYQKGYNFNMEILDIHIMIVYCDPEWMILSR